MTIAALYVETNGVYFNHPLIDPYDVNRDARLYAGPWRVIAHPPCERWGRYWHGSPIKPHQYELGDDDGKFDSAVFSARNYGGVIEHPAASHAFSWHGLPIPERGAGWTWRDRFGGRSCYVEQCNYGHDARKPTWLYLVGDHHPPINFGQGDARIPEWMIERYGYEKARRIGVVAMIGGKDKKAKRERTPIPFRDLLIALVSGDA